MKYIDNNLPSWSDTSREHFKCSVLMRNQSTKLNPSSIFRRQCTSLQENPIRRIYSHVDERVNRIEGCCHCHCWVRLNLFLSREAKMIYFFLLMLVTRPKRQNTHKKWCRIKFSFCKLCAPHHIRLCDSSNKRQRFVCMLFFHSRHSHVWVYVSRQWNRRLSNKGNNPFMERANMFWTNRYVKPVCINSERTIENFLSYVCPFGGNSSGFWSESQRRP